MILLSLGSAQAEERIALVIGNSDYDHVAELDHVPDDMLVIADTLRHLDFDVAALADLDRHAMEDSLTDFGQRIDQAGEGAVGLLFYAGHGFQQGGSNYLLPIGAEIGGIDDIDEASINLDLALAEIAFATNDHKLVILDVPTDHTVGQPWGATSGLSEIDAPVGTLVAYGALPGNIAEKPPYDGLYPLALANVLTKPGLMVEEVFQEVRLTVAEATDGVQIPWESSALATPLYLNGAPEPTVVSHLDQAGVPDFPRVDPRTVDLVFWVSIKDSVDPQDFADYLNEFPDGIFRTLAERRLDQLSEEAATVGSEYHDTPRKVADLDKQLITQKRSNVRAEPSSSGVIVATIEADQAVQITGHVVGADWFRIRLANDTDAFIWASLLAETSPPASLDGGLAATRPPSKSALLGAWVGEYHCQWDTIGFSLEITEDEDHGIETVDAIFSFFPQPDGPAIPPGSFEMSGDYDPEDGTIVLESEDWIKRPLGIQSHNLSGRAEIGGMVITGRIESPGCTEFFLSRDGGHALPTAQSTPSQQR